MGKSACCLSFVVDTLVSLSSTAGASLPNAAYKVWGQFSCSLLLRSRSPILTSPGPSLLFCPCKKYRAFSPDCLRGNMGDSRGGRVALLISCPQGWFTFATSPPPTHSRVTHTHPHIHPSTPIHNRAISSEQVFVTHITGKGFVQSG